jgi:hypothetical protein
MKTLNIQVPEGYEIDKDKSTFETIVFKQSKKQLVKSWEEIKDLNGYYVDGDCEIGKAEADSAYDDVKNTFTTEKQAKASIAFAQLSQLRDVYRQGWIPDWSDKDMPKYCIVLSEKYLLIYAKYIDTYFLSFQSKAIAEEFLENFRDLINQAKPLMS